MTYIIDTQSCYDIDFFNTRNKEGEELIKQNFPEYYSEHLSDSFFTPVVIVCNSAEELNAELSRAKENIDYLYPFVVQARNDILLIAYDVC